MQRVFFSFHVPESVGTFLLQNLRQQVKFPLYPEKNLHITLQFVGDVTDEQLEQLKDIGEAVARECEPVQITPVSFSVEEGRLRLAIESNRALADLQKNLSSKIGNVEGIVVKLQEYTPHITLGRPQGDFSLSSLSAIPADVAFLTTSFGLYKSEPGENRMGNYILIQEFQLGDARENKTAIQTIMLPVRPQPDTIVAIFLLKAFGQKQYPGIERAKILVRPTLPQGATEESLLSEGTLLIDIPGGQFDHHKQGGTASQLVVKNLKIEQSPAIAKLLAYAERDDKYGKGTISQDPLDRAFGLSGLIAALNKSHPENPNHVVDSILPLLRAHISEEQKRTDKLPLEYQEKLQSGKAQERRVRHKKKPLSVVTIESNDPSMPGWLRSSGGKKADVVIQKINSGHVNILTKQIKKIDLRGAIALLRSQEAGAKNRTVPQKAQYLMQSGRIDEVPEWYYDRATNSLLNGGLNPTGVEPTALSLEQITSLVQEGLEMI